MNEQGNGLVMTRSVKFMWSIWHGFTYLPGVDFNFLKYDISFESVAKFKYFEGTLTIQNAKIREFQLSFGPESFVFLSAKPLKIKRYSTKMLPALLYRCKTLIIKLNEEHGRRVFENRVLWETFGRKMGEVTGDWRKRHDKEFHNT